MIRRTARSTYGWSRAHPPRQTSHRRASAALAVFALGMAALVIAKTAGEAHATAPPALTFAAQHQCSALIGRVVAATNQIDFNLRTAEALRYRCLEYREGEGLTSRAPSLFGHIVRVAKVGIDQ